MKRLLYILLCLSVMVSATDAFSQKKNDKKKDKKKKVEKVEVKPIDDQKQPVVQPVEKDPGGKQPVEKQPVIQPNDEKQPVATTQTKQPVVTLEQIVAQSKPVVQQKPNGSINWTEQYIEAKGQSVIDNQKFTNPAQAKLMATRGAVVVAQRNLLEIVQGVNITSETKVKDMIAESDYIYSRVDGVVKGAQQVGEAVEKDGFIEVTMRIPIYADKGLAPVIYDNVPGKTKSASIAEVAEVLESGDLGGAEGFVFNFNGKQIDPSMFPVVVDENGKTLFDFYKLYDPTTGKFPQMLQTSKDMFQQLGFAKGVQVIDVAQSFNGKIQLDKINAGKINWEKVGKVAQQAGKVIKFALALI